MYPKNGNRLPLAALRLAVLRGVLLGILGTIGAGLFGATCGAILCLAEGLSWVFAGEWGLRGALGGLVSGVLIGVLSAIHHVEERAAKPTPAAPGKASLAVPPAAAARPAAAPDRNGVQPKGSEDRGRGSAGKVGLI